MDVFMSAILLALPYVVAGGAALLVFIVVARVVAGFVAPVFARAQLQLART